MNVNLYYNFINNSIEQVTTLENDVSKTTYRNIGKSKYAGFYFYGSWNPITKLRIFTNIAASYMDIKANDESNLKNSGFREQIFAGLQYNFPRDFTLALNGGIYSPWLNLQGKSSGSHYSAVSLNKSFLKKNLTISFSAMNVFEEYISGNSTTQTNQFRSTSDYSYVARNFRIGISYKFGEMKQQIKKVQRGINNDDSKGGGQSGGGEGSSGGGAPQ